MSEKFYEGRPNSKNEYSEYFLLNEEEGIVERRHFRLVPHVGGLKPVRFKTEIIEGFIIKDVEPKAKAALQTYIENRRKSPTS